jgi:spermidine/putrescine transport system permease protein
VPTTGDYVTPALVGGTQGTMIANLIEVQFNGAGNWPLGAALSLVSMAMVGAMAGLFVVSARAAARSVR